MNHPGSLIRWRLTMRRNGIVSLHFFTMILSFSLLTSPAFSQPEGNFSQPVTEVVIEELVVTGTRIKRQDFFSVSPIFTLDQDDFRRAGITNLEDILNDAPQMTPSTDRTSNNPGTGQAGIDLRGLGSKRTLTLLNGRRIASADVFGSVDANSIPVTLVDRVEIVTGGASAVYGSDAMAGAVNFILNTEFDGLAMDFQQDIYGAGDGEVSDLNLTFGRNLADGNANISGYLGYQDRKAVFQADRSLSRQPFADNFQTGEVAPSGSIIVPGGVSAFPPAFLPDFGLTEQVLFLTDGTARPFVDPDDNYNFAGPNYLQIPLRREMAGLFGHYDLSDTTRVSSEFIWSRNRVATQLAPAAFLSFVSQNIDHPSLTPFQQDLLANNYDFFGTGVAQFFLLRRFSELGPRHSGRKADSYRVVLDLEGSTAGDFEWDLSWTYSKTDIRQTLSNTPSLSRILQGLLADPATGQCLDPTGGCVPLSLLGDNSLTPEAARFILLDDVANFSEFREQIAAFTLTGPLNKRLGIQSAFGLEWRKQRGSFFSSDTLKSGDVVGFNAVDDVVGSIQVWEIYTELLLPLVTGKPLVKLLDLELGFRYSSYSESDSTNTWKAGLDWQVSDGLRIRAMQQRAIRTPNITELFQSASIRQNPFGQGFQDRCSADRDPVGNGFQALCVSQGIPPEQVGVFMVAPVFPNTEIRGAGNPDLRSEKADTTTVGFVWTPEMFSDLSIALDYFNIEISDAISTVGDPVTTCFELNNPDSRYCRLFTRSPSFNISLVELPFLNQATRKTSGLDLQVRYSLPLSPRWNLFGRDSSLNLAVIGTHVYENSGKQDPASRTIDCAGYFSASFNDICPTFMTPDDRVNVNLAYENSRFATVLTWKWIGNAGNAILLRNEGLVTGIPSTRSRAYLDLSMRFFFDDRFELRGGISNLLKEEPPLLANNGTQANTTPQVYDVFGRRFFLGLSFSL